MTQRTVEEKSAFQDETDEMAAEFGFDPEEKIRHKKQKEAKKYCTIDHSNKLGSGRKFDAYQYWLDQAERARKSNNGVAVIPKKIRLK